MRRDLYISILAGTIVTLVMLFMQKLNTTSFLNLIFILITTFIVSYPIKNVE
ncbi:hypothetical protein PL321_02660 [Caloramator sp. mosi_1]|uniref:hypothetical protein n=1 Tax=Caloramator sp. mosi_1 TaxID=3023090 RepID=UPI00235F40DF|nr:hypothetical protein [Caloramator sp. mosi_1]WDC84625.1 hypothetical protein PL321_02660 [Caloramator sp. mosi_1]